MVKFFKKRVLEKLIAAKIFKCSAGPGWLNELGSWIT
jgi:hypothetical protein